MPETITPPPTIESAETNNRDTTREQDRGLGWGDRGAVNLTMALRGLTANKLRAFLTMLGVIIGVGAVIIAIAIGQGSRAAVAASLQQLGTNVLTVLPGQQRSGGISFGYGSNVTLKLSDADAILKSCPSVLHVSPQVNKNAQVKYGDKNTNTTINGTSEFYPVISNHPIREGRYLNAADIKSQRRVAVLGSDTSDDPVQQPVSGRQDHTDRRTEFPGGWFAAI